MSLATEAEHLRRLWLKRSSSLPARGREWCHSDRKPAELPRQGWKLHVSATIFNACEVFDRVRPVLARRGTFFKVPTTLDHLLALNTGVPHFSQVGKFLTAYPRGVAEARELARELHGATIGYSGPEVPFDRRFRRNSMIYYRYGAFGMTGRVRSSRPPMILGPKGGAHRDRRAPGCAVPPWVEDILGPASATWRPAKSSRGQLGTRFLPFRALSQRGKGGTYEALDLGAARARLCVVKEGRCLGEVLWDGSDGRTRLQHEARVLRELRRAGLPVPEPIAEFVQDRNRYLVMAKLSGRPVGPAAGASVGTASWRRAERVFDQLAELLAAIHRLGWVWRDCKPANLFVRGKSLFALDFEGACRIDETEVVQWSAPAYTPVAMHNGLRRPRGTLEDDFALGVIAFQLGTGKLPPPSLVRCDAAMKRSGCPRALRTRIADLLGAAASLKPGQEPDKESWVEGLSPKG